MGGVNNALAWGVGTTEYANLIHSGFTMVEVPESIRFHLMGSLGLGVTAKDVMLHILLDYARAQKTLNRVMEFTGPGLSTLSMDERATLTNMATECSARSGICTADDTTLRWIAARRPDGELEELAESCVEPDDDASYAGGVHTVDLSKIVPMVAHPGDPDQGVPSDPTNGLAVSDLGEVPIDIAYAGSCTAGKMDDIVFYHKVVEEALGAGLKVADGVRFIVQFGSQEVATFARDRGFDETFRRAGVEIIPPGCGACIGCGPGVSDAPGPGDGVRHQPELQGAIGSGSSLPGITSDRGGIGVCGEDRGVPTRDVRGGSGRPELSRDVVVHQGAEVVGDLVGVTGERCDLHAVGVHRAPWRLTLSREADTHVRGTGFTRTVHHAAHDSESQGFHPGFLVPPLRHLTAQVLLDLLCESTKRLAGRPSAPGTRGDAGPERSDVQGLKKLAGGHYLVPAITSRSRRQRDSNGVSYWFVEENREGPCLPHETSNPETSFCEAEMEWLSSVLGELSVDPEKIPRP